ncbi:Copper-exporting P-type ATPase A [Aquisphaera giovannonii]|uniref:P-type Zn(2+) transporter n=2 Tax=Aquisphaera giovannonii TaxID=406548 RepID=A0A5B9WA54_9BACT|nr:Copper-exporting P-type ATPase A [Aquisphaera giovannonii]
MHREYQPDELSPLDADPFSAARRDREGGGDRGPYLFTAILGLLLGLDLGRDAIGLGPPPFLPAGLSLTHVAAVLGAVRIVYGALEALVHRRIGADFALAQACLAALVLGQPFVATEVVFIALVGEVLEAFTFSRTRKALGRLVGQAPRTARVVRDGREQEVPARDVAVGELAIIREGERIPVDGAIEEGRSTVDQSAINGESIPADKGPGDAVFAGTLNQYGVIRVRAERVGRESTFGQVVRLVSEARRRKAEVERLADRLARYFLPAVELAAILTLAAGYLRGWPDVWSRTVAVLVVACPCALVLATPAAMLASMAWLARRGVLIKGGYALERLAACDTFAFDKTGTLTEGRPRVASIVPLGGLDEAGLLGMAAAAEQGSRHPLALAVVAGARTRGIEPGPAGDVGVLPGAGVEATVPAGAGAGSGRILVGNRRLLAARGVALGEDVESNLRELDGRGETPLLVARDGAAVGLIGLRDAIRPEAHEAIHELKHLKVGEFAVLTGDRETVARGVARRLHIETVLAERMPADKAAWIRERQQAGRRVAMVGDGINDAPALAQADAGLAIGGMGADLAAEAGDFALMGDALRVLPELVELSRATVRVIRQNIVGFAFGLNGVAMLTASLGLLGPVAAAVLHQAGSLLVLLNAMRLLAFGGWGDLPPVRGLRALGQRIGRLDDRIDPEAARRWLIGRRRPILGAALGLAAMAYAAGGISRIGPGEVGLVSRFGGYRGALGPGFHWRWPPPIERVVAVEPEKVRGLEIGFRGASAGEDAEAFEESGGDGLLLTGDGQLLELSATVQYAIDARRADAARTFALGIDRPEAVIASIAEASVRKVVSRRRLLDLLTSGRLEAEKAAAAEMAPHAGRLGARIDAVLFRAIRPPAAVLDAYRDVSRAESDRRRRAIEAEARASERITLAGAAASTTVGAAEALREASLARAGGRADAFVYELEARRSAPGLSDFRRYWEAISEALADRPKLILAAPSPKPQRLFLTAPPPPPLAPSAATAGDDPSPPQPTASGGHR